MFSSVTSPHPADTVAGQFELSIARTPAELEDCFRLVYHSYVRAGLDTPNALGMRLTPYHLLPTTEVMLARKADTPISTATLILDNPLGLPAESIYQSEIDALRVRGLRVAEVGCLADRRESPARFMHMFRRLSTLIAQTAAARGCNALIAATHPRHAKFYIRQLGFDQFGEMRACPYVQGNPAVALMLDFEKTKGTEVHEHLFGKRYSHAELAPRPRDAETQSHLEAILRRMKSFSNATPSPSTAATVTPADLPMLLPPPVPDSGDRGVS